MKSKLYTVIFTVILLLGIVTYTCYFHTKINIVDRHKSFWTQFVLAGGDLVKNDYKVSTKATLSPSLIEGGMNSIINNTTNINFSKTGEVAKNSFYFSFIDSNSSSGLIISGNLDSYGSGFLEHRINELYFESDTISGDLQNQPISDSTLSSLLNTIPKIYNGQIIRSFLNILDQIPIAGDSYLNSGVFFNETNDKLFFSGVLIPYRDNSVTLELYPQKGRIISNDGNIELFRTIPKNIVGLNVLNKQRGEYLKLQGNFGSFGQGTGMALRFNGNLSIKIQGLNIVQTNNILEYHITSDIKYQR